MSDFMIHQGGEVVSVPVMQAVETPACTSTHITIPHRDLHALMENEIAVRFPNQDCEVELALNHEGMECFWMFTIDVGVDDATLAIAMRNAHNKRFCLAAAAGLSCFCCDNLSISGSSVTLMRKHTKHVWKDAEIMVMQIAASSQRDFDNQRLTLGRMKEIPCTTDRGYERIGLGLGHGVLTPTQANVAVREWREPSHEEFQDRNVYSLYNAFTEAGKRGQPGRMLDRYTGIHKFFSPEPGVVIDV